MAFGQPDNLAKAILEIEDAYAGRHSQVLTQKTARMMLTQGTGFPTLQQGRVFAAQNIGASESNSAVVRVIHFWIMEERQSTTVSCSAT